MALKTNHQAPLWTQFTKHYDWPARDGNKPFDHQVQTWIELLRNKRFFVLNDIGTGKTRTVIWAVDFLLRRKPDLKVLVVAPLSTLEVTWLREFAAVNIGIRAVVLTGTKAQRLRRLEEDWQVAIINPDGVKVVQEALPVPDILIIDEVTYYRNPRTKRYRALRDLAYAADTVWALSGNLTPKDPTDVWGPLKLLVPDRLPRSFRLFRDMLMLQVSQFRWVPREEAPQILSELLQDISIRFRRDECLDLPDVQFIDLDVPATAQQKALERELRREFAVMLDMGEVVAANAAVLVNKLLQIFSGVVYYSGGDGQGVQKGYSVVDAQPRFEMLRAIVEDSSSPVLVFAQYSAAVDVLANWAAAHKYRFVTVTGETSPKQRKEAFDAVQARAVDLLIAHPRTMAHGITLTGANTIVWWSATADQEIYLQANGRVTRPGQTSKVVVYHLVTSSVERRMYRMLRERKVTSDRILELIEQFADGGK